MSPSEKNRTIPFIRKSFDWINRYTEPARYNCQTFLSTLLSNYRWSNYFDMVNQ